MTHLYLSRFESALRILHVPSQRTDAACELGRIFLEVHIETRLAGTQTFENELQRERRLAGTRLPLQ